jgi:O-antigen ligase
MPNEFQDSGQRRWVSTANSVTWTVLLFATIVNVRFPVPGSTSGAEINISMFDPALLCALAFAILTRRVVAERIPWRIMLGLVLAELAILGHAALTYRYGTWHPAGELVGPIDRAGLLRETVKLIAIPIELAMVMLLFTADDLRKAPPTWVIALVTVIVGAVVSVQRFEGLAGEGPAQYANVEANSLAGMMTFAICVLWPGSNKDRLLALAISFGAILVMLVAMRKTFLLACAIALVLMLISLARDHRRLLWRAGLLAILATVAIGLVQAYMTREFYEGDPFAIILSNFAASGIIRLGIQIGALKLALAALPLGVGIGQFATMVSRSSELQEYAVAFAHNTPISLFVEMGVVGLLLCIGLFYLIYLACRGGDWVSRLVRLTFFMVPMMANDTHGLRMTILLIAYFAIVSEPSPSVRVTANAVGDRRGHPR